MSFAKHPFGWSSVSSSQIIPNSNSNRTPKGPMYVPKRQLRISREAHTPLKAMEACPCPSSFLSQGQVRVRRDKMFTALCGLMTSERRGSFYVAVLGLRDLVSRMAHTPAPGCGEPSWHCVRFRDQALSWAEMLRSKKKVPSLGRRGPELCRFGKRPDSGPWSPWLGAFEQCANCTATICL